MLQLLNTWTLQLSISKYIFHLPCCQRMGTGTSIQNHTTMITIIRCFLVLLCNVRPREQLGSDNKKKPKTTVHLPQSPRRSLCHRSPFWRRFVTYTSFFHWQKNLVSFNNHTREAYKCWTKERTDIKRVKVHKSMDFNHTKITPQILSIS